MWLSKLKQGLASTKAKLSSGLKNVFTLKKNLDFSDLEDVLIMSDIGVSTSEELIHVLRENKISDYDSCVIALKKEMLKILKAVVEPINICKKPHVIMVCGVNGNGKTTTCGKLASQYTEEGKSVMLVAADTFRAAAIEQLHVWAKAVGCRIVSRDTGADPASVVYSALEEAINQSVDVVIIDTAGRLHTQSNLMQELSKISRTLAKHDKLFPHDTILVLDATTGQNAFNQVKMFKQAVGLTGLIVTKIDSTSKAGVILGLSKMYSEIKLNAIGVGEKIEDLKSFEPEDFVNALLGIDL